MQVEEGRNDTKKRLPKIRAFMGITIVVVSLCIFPIACADSADQSIVQEKSLAFIENALPIDFSKYNVTFAGQSSVDLPGGVVMYTVQYNLFSATSTVTVICNIENNNVLSCHLYEVQGSLVSDKQYANQLDAVKSFLEKYQSYTKMDSTNLSAMLDEVDITKNSTSTAGNIELTITNEYWAGKDLTLFDWAYLINGVEYTSLQVGFQKNGVIDAIYDSRAVFTIGDTSVNISPEQAIEIALKNLSAYSYAMPGDVIISDFNVTVDRITTSIEASPVNSTVLRPYWTVNLPLNQTYPGSVHGIAVFIWADTGEIFKHSNIAFGGSDYPDNSETQASPSPASTSVPEFPTIVPILLIATCIFLIIWAARKQVHTV
jgi:hypothetical protein